MISVVIPLMPVEPYDKLVKDCSASLMEQKCRHEAIIVQQPVERYISKNMLLNAGFKKSKGNHVFFCDADFVLDDKMLLSRIGAKLDEGYDVVFPKFMSWQYDSLKIADGAPAFKREVMLKHGPLDEKLKGISWVTFPFLKWCLENTKYYCGDDIVVIHQRAVNKKKRNGQTASRMRPIFKQTVKRLQGEGLWPV